jgi:hypothetical protein
METTELIGVTLFALGLLAATAQMAFGWGQIVGERRERQLADRRVQGVLDYENRRRPSPKSKRKATRKRVAGELVGGVA